MLVKRGLLLLVVLFIVLSVFVNAQMPLPSTDNLSNSSNYSDSGTAEQKDDLISLSDLETAENIVFQAIVDKFGESSEIYVYSPNIFDDGVLQFPAEVNKTSISVNFTFPDNIKLIIDELNETKVMSEKQLVKLEEDNKSVDLDSEQITETKKSKTKNVWIISISAFLIILIVFVLFKKFRKRSILSLLMIVMILLFVVPLIFSYEYGDGYFYKFYYDFDCTGCTWNICGSTIITGDTKSADIPHEVASWISEWHQYYVGTYGEGQGNIKGLQRESSSDIDMLPWSCSSGDCQSIITMWNTYLYARETFDKTIYLDHDDTEFFYTYKNCNDDNGDPWEFDVSNCESSYAFCDDSHDTDTITVTFTKGWNIIQAGHVEETGEEHATFVSDPVDRFRNDDRFIIMKGYEPVLPPETSGDTLEFFCSHYGNDWTDDARVSSSYRCCGDDATDNGRVFSGLMCVDKPGVNSWEEVDDACTLLGGTWFGSALVPGHEAYSDASDGCCGDDNIVSNGHFTLDLESEVIGWTEWRANGNTLNPCQSYGGGVSLTSNPEGTCAVIQDVSLSLSKSYVLSADVQISDLPTHANAYIAPFVRCHYDGSADHDFRASADLTTTSPQSVSITFSPEEYSNGNSIDDCRIIVRVYTPEGSGDSAAALFNNVGIFRVGKDYAFFDEDAEYFCSKDYTGTGEEIEPDVGSADWKWWEATVDPFRIHTIYTATCDCTEHTNSYCTTSGACDCNPRDSCVGICGVGHDDRCGGTYGCSATCSDGSACPANKICF